MMKKIFIASAFLSALVALPAAAHHMSPMDPDIGDLLDMHQTTVDALIEDGILQGGGDMEVDAMSADTIESGSLAEIDTAN